MSITISVNPDQQKRAFMAIIESISKQAEGHTMMADSLSQFSLNLLDLVTQAAPEYIDVIEHVTNVYDEVVQMNYDHSSILKRVSEDIQDIYERHLVVLRASNEYQTAENNYKKSRIDLVKNKGKPNEAQCKEKVKKCLQTTKDSLMNLIEQKKKLWRFTLRRISHAVSFYTVALTKSSEKEVDLMSQAASIMREEAIQRIEKNSPKSEEDQN